MRLSVDVGAANSFRRNMRPLPELTYPLRDCAVFAGQKPGLKEVDESIWLVSLVSHISVSSIWSENRAVPR